jgi:hypothetical protein
MIFPALLALMLVFTFLVPESRQMNIFNDQASSENFVNSIYKDEEDGPEDVEAPSKSPSKVLSPKVIFPTKQQQPVNSNRNFTKDTKQPPLGFLDSWLKKVPMNLLQESRKASPTTGVKKLILKKKMKVLPNSNSKTVQKIFCACNCSTSMVVSPSVTTQATAGPELNKPLNQLTSSKIIVLQPKPQKTTASLTLNSFTCHSPTVSVQEVIQTTSQSNHISVVPQIINTPTISSSNATCVPMQANVCFSPIGQVSQQISVDKGKPDKVHIKADKPNEHVPLMEQEMLKILFQHDQSSKEIENTSHEELVDMRESHFLPVMRGLFLSFMHIVSKSVEKMISKHDRKILSAQCEILKHALPQTYVDTKIIKQTFTTYSIYSVTIPQRIQCITYDTRTLTVTSAPTSTVPEDDNVPHTGGGKPPMITIVPGGVVSGGSGLCVRPCCVPCCTSQISQPTMTTVNATR